MWFGTLVVPLSVVMCVRAYFFELFNITTGCMQPTIWGNHTRAGVEKGTWDVFPLSVLKWLWTGEKAVERKALATSEVSGDVIFVNRMTWNFRKPKRGDIMVFSTTGMSPDENGRYEGTDGKRYKVHQGTHYVKRMKATPGETYRLEHPVPGFPVEVTMGEDEYFACGDNFNNSCDSRHWGPVPGAKLRGTATCVIWPFSRWRAVQ